MQYTVINAFGNPVRLRLLCCLAKGQKNVQELIENCGLAQSAVSQHLTKLKQAGLVISKQDGKFVYYSLTHQKAAQLAHELEQFEKDLTKKEVKKKQ